MVDIARIAAQGTAVAFKLTKGILKTITLVLKPAEGDFNIETGKKDDSPAGTIEVSGLFYKNVFAQKKDDQSKTAMILLRQAEVKSKGYAEKINDADAAIVDGVRWEITEVILDPAEATYQLVCRR
jgi:hypothetical protein